MLFTLVYKLFVRQYDCKWDAKQAKRWRVPHHVRGHHGQVAFGVVVVFNPSACLPNILINPLGGSPAAHGI